MRKVIIVCLMLIFSFLAEYIGCEAKTDDFVWRYFQPDWQWGEREWETPWEIVRELATDDIGKMPFNAKDYGADDEKVMGKTYHLSYKLNGGEMVGETVKTYRAYEREIKLPKAKRKGYIFTGWSFGKDHETNYRTWFSLYNENGAIKGDKTLTANWKKIRVKRAGKKTIRISLFNREVYDYREIACLYSTRANMKGAKIVCLNEKFSEKKKKGVIGGRGTIDYSSNYYPKKHLLTMDLKKLKKGKTYYLEFRRINKLQAHCYNLPTIYYYMNQKVLKTVKVKL